MSQEAKFKVGQKVRFKSHEELKRIGEIFYVKVDRDFKYLPDSFTITDIGYHDRNSWKIIIGHYYSLAEFKECQTDVDYISFQYHEDFFQPAYELDEKFKGL